MIDRPAGQAQVAVLDLGRGALLELVRLPGGQFLMGSPPGLGYDDERPQHLVTLPPFLIGRGPVTQAQWLAVMRRLPPCRYHGPDRPVENVTWREATEFCQKLARRVGRGWRVPRPYAFALPSEAQWEYACRGGTLTPFSCGHTLTTDLANYVGTHTYGPGPVGVYRHETTPVGQFPPNAFGLYDMHGNVWEWCADPWHDDYTSAPEDGAVWESDVPAAPRALRGGTLPNAYNTAPVTVAGAFAAPFPARLWERSAPPAFRVMRGGSWHDTPDSCRSAVRSKFPADEVEDYIGFRVVAPSIG